MHHAWGIKNLSFALSCVDNRHQRQQGGLSTGVLCCLVSIWLSDILLDFISWLERSEFSLKSWQAEQTEFPRYFPVPAADCEEKSSCWTLMEERALGQQWHVRTQNCAGAEDNSSQCWLTLTFPSCSRGGQGLLPMQQPLGDHAHPSALASSLDSTSKSTQTS